LAILDEWRLFETLQGESMANTTTHAADGSDEPGTLDLQNIINEVETLIDAVRTPQDRSKWGPAFEALGQIIIAGKNVWPVALHVRSAKKEQSLAECCIRLKECCNVIRTAQGSQKQCPILPHTWFPMLSQVVDEVMGGHFGPEGSRPPEAHKAHKEPDEPKHTPKRGRG
jgi:hypothetical protein